MLHSLLFQIRHTILDHRRALFNTPLNNLYHLDVYYIHGNKRYDKFQPSNILPRRRNRLTTNHKSHHTLERRIFRSNTNNRFMSTRTYHARRDDTTYRNRRHTRSKTISAISRHFIQSENKTELEALTSPLPINVRNSIINSQLRVLQLRVVKLFFRQLATSDYDMPTDRLVTFPLQTRTLRRQSNRPFTNTFDLYKGTRPVITFVPPIVTSPTPIHTTIRVRNGDMVYNDKITNNSPGVRGQFMVYHLFHRYDHERRNRNRNYYRGNTRRPRL